MPKILTLVVFCLLLALTAMGQKAADDYTKKIDSLISNQNARQALQLAIDWEAEAREKLGENSLERAVSLAQYARAIFVAKQDYPLADSLFQVSLQLMRNANAEQTNDYAEALRFAGISKSRQGNLVESIALTEKAWAIQTKLFGTDHISTLKSQAFLASPNRELGRYEVANNLCVTGIAAMERIGTADAPLYYFYLMIYSGVLADQHRFSKAIEFYEKGIALGKKIYGEKHPTYHSGLFDLARTYDMANRLEEAEALLYHIIQISNNRTKYRSYLALGSLQVRIGLFIEAEQNLQLYLGYLERTGVNVPLEFASTFATLSGAYSGQGQFKKADSLQLKALQIYAQTMGDTSFAYLQVLLFRVHSVMEHNDPGEASALLQDISTKYFRQIEADPSLLETFLRAQGGLAFRLGDFQKATDLCSQAIEVSAKNILAGLRLKAMSLLRLNNMPELESTAQALVQAAKFDAQTNFAFLSDAERQQLFYVLEDIRNVLASMRLQKSKLNIDETLFDLQLFTKNLLENTTRKTQLYVQNSGDATLLSLFNDWTELHDQLNFAYQLSPEEAQNVGLDLKTLEEKAENLEKEILRRGAPLIQNEKQPTWGDIRNGLKSGEAALDVMRFQLYDGKNYQDTAIYAFSILKPGATQPELVFLENGNDLESFALGQYQNEITRKKDLSPNLYEKMWASVAAHLQGVKTLYFSPDGIFHKINLNTLRAADGTYLLDNIEIKQVTNLRNILDRGHETSGSEPGMAALFGNPAFNTGTMASTFSATGDLTIRTPLYRDIAEDAKGELHLPPLPGSEREVNAIAKKLADKNWQSAVFTGAQATEDTLKQLKSPKVLHIATHGYFLNSEKTNSTIGLTSPHAGKNPALRSMLFFAGAENSIAGKNIGRNDGILTAFEAAVLNLDQTELVVLSACNTGLGKIQNGEGVFGLQRAFRIAGAKSLIMSLWEVEDAATELLMNSFYENWLGGMSKSDAFRKAQLTLKAKYPQPFYWGSFILVNG